MLCTVMGRALCFSLGVILKNCILKDLSSAFLFYLLTKNSHCKIASQKLWDLKVSILASRVFCACNTLSEFEKLTEEMWPLHAYNNLLV